MPTLISYSLFKVPIKSREFLLTPNSRSIRHRFADDQRIAWLRAEDAPSSPLGERFST